MTGPCESATGARFVVLEGLGAVGKSTIAPLLAQAIGAVQVGTLVPELAQTRRHLDHQRSAEARLHFWLMVNYLASDVVRETLSSGRDVVLESYFYRAIATHAAMGVRELPVIDWDHAVAPDLAIELRIEESVRQQRLAARARAGSRGYWSVREERNIAAARSRYDSFGLAALDTTGMSPAEVVASAARLTQMTGAEHV